MPSNLTEWLNDVLAQAPGVGPTMVANAVRMSCREFCRGTHLWFDDVMDGNSSPFDLVEGDGTYDIPTLASTWLTAEAAQIVEIMAVRYREAGTAEVVTVTCSGVGSLSQGDYFVLRNANNNQTYAFNIDIDADTTVPTGEAYTVADNQEEIDVLSTDTLASEISAKVHAIVNAVDGFTSVDGSGSITVTNDTTGPVPDAVNYSADDSGAGGLVTAVDTDGSRVNFSFLTPVVEDRRNLRTPASWKYVEPGTPSEYYVTRDFEVVLVPPPVEDSKNGMVVQAYLQPTNDATTVESFIYDEHYDEILWGALARLFEIPNQPWTSPKMYAFYRAKFLAGLGAGRMKKWHGRSNRPMRVTARPWAI